MPFIPHTNKDIQAMLDAIGVESIDDLFSEVPSHLKVADIDVPEGMNEMQLARHMATLAAKDDGQQCFIGAGAYDHHIPACVWDIVGRGEFMTAYTPYQAEASQGTLQVLYEFQTMMTSLTGLDVSNASCYDGATALAEAVLMAVRANKKAKSKKIGMPLSIHPAYRETVKTIVSAQGIECVDLPFDSKSGLILTEGCDEASLAAVVVPNVNFFGVIESVDELTDWAHSKNALVVALCNPISLALLKEPGAWGSDGADIACGEAQPLGMPLASGGPYAGYLCCKQALVRQMPGRIVGRTVDSDGHEGFTLTLQAREQHIRRSKATSNICTNQGLLVTAATIHMGVLGYEGLKRVAIESHNSTVKLRDALLKIPGIKLLFNSEVFHEVALSLPVSVDAVLEKMAEKNIQAGFALKRFYSDYQNGLLVCVTETKTNDDLKNYVAEIKAVIEAMSEVVA